MGITNVQRPQIQRLIVDNAIDAQNAINAQNATSASYAITASYALNGSSGGVTINNNTNNFLITATGTANTLNGEANLQFNGSTLTVTGNANISSGITGSLFGTASYVTGSIFTSINPALSASYALTASYALNSSGTGTPGGANTTIQFNDSGIFSGSSNFIFGKSTNTVSLLNGGNVVISSSATPSNTPLLIDIKSGSTNGAYHALGIATQDGGGIGLGYNGYPSTYRLEMSPWFSGEALINASNAPSGFRINGASTKLVLSTDLPSFPITLRPGNVATGGGIVEVSGSLNITNTINMSSFSPSTPIEGGFYYDGSDFYLGF